MHTTWSDMTDPTIYLDTLGIDEPTELTDLYALAAEVRAIANVCPAPAPSPHDERFTPKNIAEAISARVLAEQSQKWARVNLPDFERHASTAARELYAGKATEYLPQIARATTKPLQLLTKAAKDLRPGDTADTVLERGEAAIRAWKTRDDLEGADTTLAAATALSAYFAQRLPESTRDTRKALRDLPEVLWWLDITDHHTLDQVDAELWDGSGADRWLEVIRAGYKPSLATPAEAIERAEAIAESRRTSTVFVGRNEEKQLKTQRAWLEAQQQSLADGATA